MVPSARSLASKSLLGFQVPPLASAKPEQQQPTLQSTHTVGVSLLDRR